MTQTPVSEERDAGKSLRPGAQMDAYRATRTTPIDRSQERLAP